MVSTWCTHSHIILFSLAFLFYFSYDFKCNLGYLCNPEYYGKNLKVKCQKCQKHTCFKCKEKVSTSCLISTHLSHEQLFKWENDHEGKTCEELAAFNATNGADFISRILNFKYSNSLNFLTRLPKMQ